MICKCIIHESCWSLHFLKHLFSHKHPLCLKKKEVKMVLCGNTAKAPKAQRFSLTDKDIKQGQQTLVSKDSCAEHYHFRLSPKISISTCRSLWHWKLATVCSTSIGCGKASLIDIDAKSMILTAFQWLWKSIMYVNMILLLSMER